MHTTVLLVSMLACAELPTYTDSIADIINRKCVLCHREEQTAPFDLIGYDQVAGWSATIAEVVEQGRMPPWHADPQHGHFANDRSLTAEEKQLLIAWAKAGAPRGQGVEPELPEYPTGWNLPREPDAVYWMRDEPFEVPAGKVLDYQYFTVDPGFTEDKWIQAIEVVPGAPEVVHHAGVLLQPPGDLSKEISFSLVLAGYVPGRQADQLTTFPDGAGILVPAGSKLRFQLHYTPIGRTVRDRTKVGVVFADPITTTHRVVAESVVGSGFEIPPHTDGYRFEAQKQFDHEVTVRALNPHMHYRGKSFTYEAQYPDGRKETLLHVPDYDFNWQTAYLFEEPKVLPSGTVLKCTATWDNSDENPANPDPSATVRWGLRSSDEMMNGSYQLVVPR